MESQDQARPFLSLVVATFGRRQELLSLLESIPTGQRSEIEVLVIDQNAEVLRPELAKLSGEWQLKHIPVSFCNASAARNFGAQHASADWLMFPDDDALFLPDTLERALQMIRTDGFDLISGKIVDESGVPHLLQWLPDAAEITQNTIEQTFVESSFFIRRTLLLNAGGFDSLFGPGGSFPSAEGADLIQRIWRQVRVRARYDFHCSLPPEQTHTAHCNCAPANL
jgi:glycosyltransferase involved in cell wall biosynthesis